jgi:hypothetical protein
LLDVAPTLIALALVFVPLLSEEPPGATRRRRSGKSGSDTLKSAPGTVQRACHLHGLPPQPNAHHRIDPS